MKVLDLVHLSVSNSRFLNLQKATIFYFFYIDAITACRSKDITKIVFDNITVISNATNYPGFISYPESLLYFQSMFRAVKLIFSNSLFANNKAIAGVIGLAESLQINLTLVNNTFDNNYGSSSGAVLSAQNMQNSLNQMHITDNVFTNNLCSGQGGVFYIFNTHHNITSLNNIYTNNTARNGGVGYVYGTKLAYYEYNGTYNSNSSPKSICLILKANLAQSGGGAWFFYVNMQKRNGYFLSFNSSSFLNSSSDQGKYIEYIRV